MQASEVSRAVVAAMSVASSLGLTVDDVIVLHHSNRLTVRLLPCDVLARVAAVAHQVAQFEVELAQRLAESGCPVATLEPRVAPRLYESDGFVVTLWTYYEPAAPAEASPADYATALERLHAGMRKLVSHRHTSPIASTRPSSSWRAATTRRRSPSRTGSCSATRYEAWDEGSANAAVSSSWCTASRTRATCSPRRTGCCS
jgi:hypothetical protein